MIATTSQNQTTQPTTEHTPTPWHIDGTHICYDGYGAIAKMPEHNVMGYAPKSKEEAAGNATFIVRAVNAHDALVEQLDVARQEIVAWRKGLNSRTFNKTKVGGSYASLDRVKDALALANGDAT